MININIDKAKVIAHEKRRQAREEEFKPYDDAIAKQIPGHINDAEPQRQIIREKYAVMQTAIDASTSIDEIKQAML